MKRMTALLALATITGVAVAPAIPVLADDQAGGSQWRMLTGPGGMVPLPRDLEVAEVRHMIKHYLAWEYHGRLEIGVVKVRDDDAIIADLVTPDGYLVQRLEVNRHTGWVRPVR